jgi:iron complex transport system ATP-binding protein
MSADTTTDNCTRKLMQGKGLCYSVNNIQLLEDVSIEVSPGELVGLIGPNGAGKSTLLRLLTQVMTPDSGEILYGNKPLQQMADAERARSIGYLVQGARAHWPFSVDRVVALGRLPHQGWWQKESTSDREKIETALRETETLAYRNRLVNTLSGGEQTLVMLARIFATEPRLIFADEPVAALDPYHQLHVMELLRKHATDDCACVVVLHDLSLAARFCDKLYMLNHGKLFCSGTPVEVLTEKNISEVYGVESLIQCNRDGVSVTPVKRKIDHHP